jgi:hypothetical protein
MVFIILVSILILWMRGKCHHWQSPVWVQGINKTGCCPMPWGGHSWHYHLHPCSPWHYTSHLYIDEPEAPFRHYRPPQYGYQDWTLKGCYLYLLLKLCFMEQFYSKNIDVDCFLLFLFKILKQSCCKPWWILNVIPQQ